MNLFATMSSMDAALVVIEGSVSSGYRCERVNKAVGGAASSRHMRGLAIDIKPSPAWNIKDAAEAMWQAAIEDKLGLVQQVIQEPTWVHVGWYSPIEVDVGMNLLRKETGLKYTTLAHRKGVA